MKTNYEDCTIGYSILEQCDLEALHEGTMNVMSEYGVKIFGKEPQEIFRDAGCEVDAETGMVKFPRNLVEDCIQSAPAEYTLHGRNPEKSITIGGKRVAFTNFSTGVEIIDPYTQEKRETTIEDISNLVRFMDAVDEIDTIILPVVGQDAPSELRELYEAEALFHNTSKHFEHDTDGKLATGYFLKMAEAVAGGKDALRERPIVSMGVCPNSPLELHQGAAESIIAAAEAGVPMSVLSMGLCGGTTPVTLAGTILTTNCEILSGIVLGQLVRKGTPMLYGSSTSIMDLKLATSPVGAPEHGMVSAAVGQIGHYYGIPTYVGGT